MKIGRWAAVTIALVAIGGTRLRWHNGGARPFAHHSVAKPSTALPCIGFTGDAAEAISKIELTQSEPDEEEPWHCRTVILEKSHKQWEITSPLKTRASASKVAALLENLRQLSVTAVIDPGALSYDSYDLTDAKALRVVAWSGNGKASDLYFGRTDKAGRSVRIAERDGVYAVANSGPGGYLGFLYTRGLRSWRETSILQFGEDEAVEVEVTNKNGRFSFARNGNTWSGTLTKRDRRGKLGSPERDWTMFDGNSVGELVRAYRVLSADDFGDERKMAGSGVDNAEQTGGVVRIKLTGAAGDRTIKVGKISTNVGRWAIKDSRWAIDSNGDGTLYVLAPSTADWAIANASKFERALEPHIR